MCSLVVPPRDWSLQRNFRFNKLQCKQTNSERCTNRERFQADARLHARRRLSIISAIKFNNVRAGNTIPLYFRLFVLLLSLVCRIVNAISPLRHNKDLVCQLHAKRLEKNAKYSCDWPVVLYSQEFLRVFFFGRFLPARIPNETRRKI